jgi:two-component system cell cycle response regulator
VEVGTVPQQVHSKRGRLTGGRLIARIRRAWKRLVRFEREWHAAAPTLFAALALSLLLYNHVEKQVTDLAFWLGLALIATVFLWLLQNNHQQSRLDPVTGLANRLKLHRDLAEAGSSDERHTLVLLELDGLGTYRDRFGFKAGDELLRRFSRDLRRVVDQLGGTAYRVEGGRFSALLPTGGRRPGELVMAVSVPIDYGDEEAPIDRPYGEVTVPDETSEADVALKVAGARLAAHRQRQRRSAKRQAQDALAAVLTTRRPELEEHLRAVAFRAISVGRAMGLEQDQLDDVVTAARLQNIGMLAVPDAVLDKKGELSAAETHLIRDHTSAGARMISAAPGLAPVATLVRSSCEHFDGSGYPDGLSGDSIPLGSRVVAVCVAYTALTAQRPHRPARTAAEALEVLRGCAGTQFDPRVVDALAEDLDDEIPPPRSEPVSLRV